MPRVPEHLRKRKHTPFPVISPDEGGPPRPSTKPLVLCPACGADRSRTPAKCVKCGHYAVERVEARGDVTGGE